MELSLEPNALPAARACQEAMFAQIIRLAASESAAIKAHHARLNSAGVEFLAAPWPRGPVKIALSAATSGNLNQVHQPA